MCFNFNLNYEKLKALEIIETKRERKKMLTFITKYSFHKFLAFFT